MVTLRGARRGLSALVVAAACAVVVPSFGPLSGQTFRSSVDLIAVDVQVIGRDRQPPAMLRAQDFEVTLDGRKRPVLSASFTRHELTPLDPRRGELVEPGRGETSGLLAPAPAGDAVRTFIISIDTASFRSLDAQVAVIAAQRFVQQLSPRDAVGVFTLPDGPRVLPTTSHAIVRQAIGRIVGRKPTVPGQFGMTVEQVIDITATAATQSLLAARRTVGQMFQDETTSGDQITCSGTTSLCTEGALNEAESRASALEDEVMEGLVGLNSLLRLLQEFPGRKTVLLLSGGMPVSDRSGGRPNLATEVKRLGDQATYANATIHALYFDQDLNVAFDAEGQKPRASSGRTRAIYTRALAEFSEPSGGTLIEVSTGAGEREIDRLLAETSTYYVLGVEPDDRDRDGRPHRLSVKVNQRGVTVKSRRLVLVPQPRK